MSTSVQSHIPRTRSDLRKHIVIVSLLVAELIPLYMMVQVSLKSDRSFFQNPWLPDAPDHWLWSNYLKAFKVILPYVANTVFVAVTSTCASLFFALMGAYFFARYRMPLSRILWGGFLLLMLLPGVANIVTLFSLLRNMGLLNTLWALIILSAAGGQVFGIYVLRNFIEDIPRDFFEAAEIDGASHFQQMVNVVVPMSGPILATLAILKFLGSWNDFLMPLIVLRDPELFTIGVGLIYLDGEYVKHWGEVMAAFLVASLPLLVIFLFTMKLFVKGLSSGALKG